MNTVNISKKARKQIAKLPNHVAAAIFTAAKTLKDWPDCKNVKSLKGRQDYRLRVGNYRVFFEVETATKTIFIMEVKKRDERTY